MNVYADGVGKLVETIGMTVHVDGVPVGGGPPPLPYDAEIEYLESAGTQWIDTGIIPQDDTIIDLRCQPYVPLPTVSSATGEIFAVHRLGETTQPNGSYAVFFKVFTHANITYCCITFTGGNGTRVQSLVAPRPTIQSLTSVVLKANQVEINGTVYNFTTPTVYPLNIGQSLPLFAVKGGNGIVALNRAVGLRLTSFSMYSGETIVRDFIPVRVGSTGYLYDRANPDGGPLGNGLYGNAADDQGGVTGFPANCVGPDK